jgi:hypothetical protein
MAVERNKLLFACFVVAVGGVVLFAGFARWFGLSINVQPQTVANILAPLMLTSAFIERAVEVFITPLRDPGANQLQAKLAATNSDPAATTDQKNAATDALNAFVGETTQYAFATAVMFGLVAAMVGVRGLSPFLDASTIKDIGQRNTFIVFDVVLSAALMAGGANGIHSVVTAFTSFFDASAQKSQNSVN